MSIRLLYRTGTMTIRSSKLTNQVFLRVHIRGDCGFVSLRSITDQKIRRNDGLDMS